MRNSLPDLLIEFFSRNDFLQDQFVFISRRDGHLLYSNQDKSSSQSAAALMSGLWQAAQALVNFIPSDNQGDSFRLTYDTSSKGLYICPIIVHKEEYYLGVSYAGVLNPGQLKQNIKHTALRLSDFINKNVGAIKVEVDKGETYLFQEISDEEMDRIFPYN